MIPTETYYLPAIVNNIQISEVPNNSVKGLRMPTTFNFKIHNSVYR